MNARLTFFRSQAWSARRSWPRSTPSDRCGVKRPRLPERSLQQEPAIPRTGIRQSKRRLLCFAGFSAAVICAGPTRTIEAQDILVVQAPDMRTDLGFRDGSYLVHHEVANRFAQTTSAGLGKPSKSKRKSRGNLPGWRSPGKSRKPTQSID